MQAAALALMMMLVPVASVVPEMLASEARAGWQEWLSGLFRRVARGPLVVASQWPRAALAPAESSFGCFGCFDCSRRYPSPHYWKLVAAAPTKVVLLVGAVPVLVEGVVVAAKVIEAIGDMKIRLMNETARDERPLSRHDRRSTSQRTADLLAEFRI